MQILLAFGKVAINHLYRQKQHAQMLHRILLKYPGITQYSIRRMKNYSSFIALSNLWFCHLRGFSMTQKENECALALASASALYDELLDVHGFDQEQIESGVLNPMGEHKEILSLLKELDTRLRERLTDVNLYSKYYQLIIRAQIESGRQLKEKNLPENEIRRISYEKGGYAMLVWRCALAHPLKAGEEEAIYLMGVILQLVNDIFDLHKDTLSGERTLVSISSNLFSFQREYNSLIREMISLYKKVDYNPKRTRFVLRMILTGLTRGSVAIEQHTKLQKDESNVFNPKDWSREELICDMEKWKNIRRSFGMCMEWEKEVRMGLGK